MLAVAGGWRLAAGEGEASQRQKIRSWMVGGELANCSCRTGVGGYSIPELKRDLLRAEQACLVASDGKCTLLPDELRDPAFGVHRFCVTRLYDRCRRESM